MKYFFIIVLLLLVLHPIFQKYEVHSNLNFKQLSANTELNLYESTFSNAMNSNTQKRDHIEKKQPLLSSMDPFDINELKKCRSSIAQSEKMTLKPLFQYINSQEGKLSFYYENLISGEIYEYNANSVYRAASTIKLPLVLYIYQQVADHRISLDDTLIYQSRHYYDGSGIIQYEKFGTIYTVKQLTEYAIIHSDNIAFIMLKEYVGKSDFIRYMKSLGADHVYPNGKNLTNCLDMSLYLKALIAFKERYPILGEELLYFLENTDYKDTIEAGIKRVPVAHKVGYIPMYLVFNDVAIINDQEPYILMIFTEGIPYDKERQVIAEIAKLIDNLHVNERSNKGLICSK